MQNLIISKASFHHTDSMKSIATQMNSLNTHSIEHINWQEYPYKPRVKFSIAYTSHGIYLQYSVSEETVLAAKENINDGVCNDSCVEFFISCDNTDFKNFEFSCIGQRLVFNGPDRNNRQPLTIDHIQSIRTLSSLGDATFKEKPAPEQWQMTIEIPWFVISDKPIDHILKDGATANFYKCGDLQETPHYLSWAPITAEIPDFHTPKFFGKLSFQK